MTISVQAKGAPQAPVQPAQPQSDLRQATTNEPAQVEVTPEPAKPDPMSPKFAALAKKERQLQALQSQLKADRDALKTEQEKYKTGFFSKDRLKEDPLTVLAEAGLDYNAITEKLLNSGQPQDPVIQKLLAQVEALSSGQKTIQDEAEKSRKQSYDNAVAVVRSEVSALVEANPNDYELIKATGEHDAVVEIIKATFQDEGRMMSTQEACKEVEDYLLEEALKLAGLEKIKAKFLPKVPEAGTQKGPEAPQTQNLLGQSQQAPKAPSKTLSAQVTSNKPLSKRERAILAFEGKLN